MACWQAGHDIMGLGDSVKQCSDSCLSKELLWLAFPHEPTGDNNPHYKKVLTEKLPVIERALANELEDRV